ncbi:hypothetical protein [Lysobacter enzymogenes]|uniref:hypothetical protein n=1 Tax=Lysobacter enzymogenes TaxID=69 RepID=UPI001AFA4C50|nr:hypothetical protein [Lysobacter enzymogenes]QQQ00351.1 hypothetical protein JHW41_19990 [Lysobacter enzymogenes]
MQGLQPRTAPAADGRHPRRLIRNMLLAAAMASAALASVAGADISAMPAASASPASANPASAKPRPAPAARASAAASTVADLVARLRARAAASQRSPAVRADYLALLRAQGLSEQQLPYADFAWLRLLFEASRDGGYWNLRWAITDREPNSDAIWRQWQSVRAPAPDRATAVAECDELSAFYAVLARLGGVGGVGLLWPTSNHTVAVWSRPGPPREARIVVPTTLIFLGRNDSFGTRGFDPWKQKRIYPYTRADIAPSQRLPPALAEFLIAQADRYADASGLSLQRLRELREGVLKGALGAGEAASQARRQRDALPAGAQADLAAYAHFIAAMRGRGPELD